MTLPGSVMLSEQECLRKVRKPLMGKGKKADKQVIDKNGNPVWITAKEYDPAKSERMVLELIMEKGKDPRPVTVYTRGSKPAARQMSICNEAYNYFISSEVPEGFHAPRNFKPTMPVYARFDKKTRSYTAGKPVNQQAWLAMSKTERLEWHLRNICESCGGVLASYNILDN